MNHATDQQLLRDYHGSRSEAAFAELVRRHVDIVYSAALRMVRDTHLAEDVTQGVFVALAQNARPLIERPVLSGWLHRTAQNLAANAVRTDVRRRAREQEAAAMNELLAGETEAAWEHIAPHLDAALGELSDSDRDALLLRYFERKSAQEMAHVLGVTEEAAQKRVSRAVERLREFFLMRGVAVGTGGLALMISSNSVQAAPQGLGATLTGTSLASATTGTGSTLTLLKLMAMTKLKVGIISTLVLVSVGIPLVIEYNGEPSHGGKTVTQWLESLQLYSYSNIPGAVQMVMRPSEAVAADPALRAISAIGPRAVPVLMQRISEPGELPPTMTQSERWKVMLRWQLLHKPGPSGNWVQQDRKHAAGVALLTLGTNAGGGFAKFMEAYVAAPRFISVAGGRLSGMPVGVAAQTVVRVAYGALPERRAEIVAAVMAGLEHTNDNYRMLALEAAYNFPEELLQRKELFLKLTLDEYQYVQAAALGDLNPVVYYSRLRPLMSLAEVRKAAETVLDSPSTPERNKGMARNVIRYVDQQETQPVKSPAPRRDNF